MATGLRPAPGHHRRPGHRADAKLDDPPPGKAKTRARWCRDMFPAACHDFSKTQEDSRGLQGNGTGQQVTINSLPRPDFTRKVARRRRFSKIVDAGSRAGTSLGEEDQT